MKNTPSAERLARLRELLNDALERDPLTRAPWLASVCAGDDELRAEVERLLAAHDGAGAVDAFVGAFPVALDHSGNLLNDTAVDLADSYRVERELAAAAWQSCISRTT